MHIQEARLFRRIKVKDLAKVVGVSMSTVSSWQKGEREPNPAQKKIVAQSLGMDVTYGPPVGNYTRRNIRASKARTPSEVARIILAENGAGAPAPVEVEVDVWMVIQEIIQVIGIQEAIRRLVR